MAPKNINSQDRKLSSGKADSGGNLFQDLVIAFIATHMLAGRPLGWIELGVPDIPTAIWAQSGGPGDDIRVEIDGTREVFEIECKRGLRADSRLFAALDHLQKIGNNKIEHGIIAINPTSSLPIRDKLREDLARIAQGRTDNLHDVTNRVIDHLAKHSTEPLNIAGRISIVELDIEWDSSAHRKQAIEMLAHALTNPDQATKVWDILIAEGQRLSAKPGRRNLESLVKLLSGKNIGFISTTYAGALTAYSLWLKEYTSTFNVPGLGRTLPINEAWVSLNALSNDSAKLPEGETLAKRLAKYHEWERLAHHDDSYNAKALLEFGNRVVVVGGPGSGKSTLCKRVTHDLATQGQKVLWVNLKRASRRVNSGTSIDDAFWETATDGSDISHAILRNTLSPPAYLILDGLDECVNLTDIIDGIRRWSISRSETHIIITTRPAGYDPAFFEDWVHAELLPLDTDSVDRFASMLIAIIRGDVSQLDEDRQQFRRQLKDNRVASIAARSPLFLGFLVQLFLAGVAFGKYRTKLFNDIVRLIQELEERDRVQVESAIAHRSLEIIGWLLQHASSKGKSYSKDSLAAELATYLETELAITNLNAQSQANQCLDFWLEKGILERVSMGREDAVTFIHLSLGEYAAGRFASQLSDKKRSDWLTQVRHNPRWREVILLAAGSGAAEEIVDNLLRLYANGPVAAELVLAAAALEETDPIPSAAEKVIKRLAARLTSPIPTVAFEAANSASGPGAKTPQIIAELPLQQLFEHPQSWTRLAAFRLALADCNFDNFEALEAFLDQSPPKTSGMGFAEHEDWLVWNDIVKRGAKLLAVKKPGDETVARLARLTEESSMYTVIELYKILDALGHPEIEQTQNRERAKGVANLNLIFDRSGDLAFLEAIIRVTGFVYDAFSDSNGMLTTLSKLIYGLNIPEAAISSVFVLSKRIDEAALDSVLKGAILALAIDHQELGADACAAKNMIEKSNRGLLMVVPRVPFTLNWSLARDADISPVDLASALAHPSSIVATSATYLINAGVGGTEVPTLVGSMLESAGDRTMQLIVFLAEMLWGNEASEVLLNRLDGDISIGCRWLFEYLPDIASASFDQRTKEIYLRGLRVNNAKVVKGAAVGLKKFGAANVKSLKPTIEFTLDHWTNNKGLCERCELEVTGASCSHCSIVPESPRAALLETLFITGNLNLNKLLTLCTDERSDVVAMAVSRLKEMLAGDKVKLKLVLRCVNNSKAPIKALEAILGLPTDIMTPAKHELLRLFGCTDPAVRQKMLGALMTAEWLSFREATALANHALDDTEPAVRDRAVKTLRSLY